MSEDRYPIRIDEATGRARVTIAGEISARKILNTFAAIVMNKRWSEGDRTVLWDAKAALFQGSFEFTGIFEATQMSKALTRPGKSAIIVERNSTMQKKVAHFYQSIAQTATNREVKMFFDDGSAMTWLDQ